MANTNDKPPAAPVHTTPLDEHGVVLINRDAPAPAIRDAISEHLSQVRAMLAVTYGEPDNTFYSLSDEHMDHYHWALARQMMVIECLVELLVDARQ